MRRRADDIESAHAWLSAQPYLSPGQVMLMGQSQGATATMVAAQRQSAVSRRIVGAIAMYPTCNFGVNAKFQHEKPLLILIGDEDTWTPASACEQLKAAQTEPTGLELTVYPGARHSFDNPGVYRMVLGKYPVGEHAKSSRIRDSQLDHRTGTGHRLVLSVGIALHHVRARRLFERGVARDRRRAHRRR